MEIRNFTPEDYPAIVAIHNSLNIIWPERPRTPEAWAEADRHRDPRCKHGRWVATVDNRVVGTASYSQYSGGYHPQWVYIKVEVLPEFQQRGIGSALFDRMMDGLRDLTPCVLRADAFTNLPQGFAFLQKRGFHESFRETPVHLDVHDFDPEPFVALEPGLNSQGIFIKTFRDLEVDPDRDRKIYTLYCAVAEDVPNEEEALIEHPDFDDWLAWELNDPSNLQDACLIAVHGDDYIGLREIAKNAEHTALLGGLLGVRREYRKRGIGMTMQLRNIAYAREHGYRLLKDCTAIQNTAMQAMFNRLGFTRDPEWQQCQKNINEDHKER